MADYTKTHSLHESFCHNLEDLITRLLKRKGIIVQSVTSRVKDEDSLRNKVQREDKQYTQLSDITDVCGIRIVTYFAEDVKHVADVIKSEFDIDQDNSVDKGDVLKPDQFGYRSEHYVVQLTPLRLQLSEYANFADCKVEVQVRSILQHAWAEIEHDLGYKTELAVPKPVIRRFARLAGLLELADDEFDRLRCDLAEYEKEVDDRIAQTPADVSLDLASLRAYILGSEIATKLDTELANIANAKLIQPDDKLLSSILEKLAYLGLNAVADLDMNLTKYHQMMLELARLWVKSPRSRKFTVKKPTKRTRGNCIFFMCYFLLTDSNHILDYLDKFSIGVSEERIAIAKDILSVQGN